MGKRVLLADDSITIQKLVEMAFSDTDFELFSVSDGKQAVDKLAEVKPDIILADAIMPMLDGYQVCEFVKTKAEFQHIPVILLTGRFQPFDEAKSKRVKIDARVVKPFVQGQLVEMIKEMTAQSAPSEDEAEELLEDDVMDLDDVDIDLDEELPEEVSAAEEEDSDTTRTDVRSFDIDSHATIRVNPDELKAYLHESRTTRANEAGPAQEPESLNEELLEETIEDVTMQDSDQALDESFNRSIDSLDLESFEELEEEAPMPAFSEPDEDVVNLEEDAFIDEDPLDLDEADSIEPQPDVQVDGQAADDEVIDLEGDDDIPSLLADDDDEDPLELGEEYLEEVVEEGQVATARLPYDEIRTLSMNDEGQEGGTSEPGEDSEELTLEEPELEELDQSAFVLEGDEEDVVDEDLEETIILKEPLAAVPTPDDLVDEELDAGFEFMDEPEGLEETEVGDDDDDALDLEDEADALDLSGDDALDLSDDMTFEEPTTAELEETDVDDLTLDANFLEDVPSGPPAFTSEAEIPAETMEPPSYGAISDHEAEGTQPIPEPSVTMKRDEEAMSFDSVQPPEFQPEPLAMSAPEIEESLSMDEEDLITEPTDEEEIPSSAMDDVEDLTDMDTAPIVAPEEGLASLEIEDFDDSEAVEVVPEFMPETDLVNLDETSDESDELGFDELTESVDDEEAEIEPEEAIIESVEVAPPLDDEPLALDLGEPVPLDSEEFDSLELAEAMPTSEIATEEFDFEVEEETDDLGEAVAEEELAELVSGTQDEIVVESEPLEEPLEMEPVSEIEPELEPLDEPQEAEDTVQDASPMPASIDSLVFDPTQLDYIVEQVAKRVVELLTDSAVREIAWEVIPELSEAIIKKRIYQLEQEVDD